MKVHLAAEANGHQKESGNTELEEKARDLQQQAASIRQILFRF